MGLVSPKENNEKQDETRLKRKYKKNTSSNFMSPQAKDV